MSAREEVLGRVRRAIAGAEVATRWCPATIATRP